MLSTNATQPIDLQPLHTFGLKAQADALQLIEGVEDLQLYAKTWRLGQPTVLLGDGSNTVFVSPHVHAVVWKMALQGKQYLGVVDGMHRIVVQAGENWHNLVEWTVVQGWCGLENLALIPGTVGAAPVQNIGAYGVELKDRVLAVHVFDAATGHTEVWEKARCLFAYRDSVFKQAQAGRYVITAVEFGLPVVWLAVLNYGDVAQRANALVAHGQALSAVHVMKAVCAIRSEKLPDPAVLGNSGSFFKNPLVTLQQFEALKAKHPNIVSFPVGDDLVKLAAGWLIDQCGLKGFERNGVGVYHKQALILVNHGQGGGEDLKVLIQHVQTCVHHTFGVLLEPEPNLI
jgi:UDP-N-acetylmuramate dehydrogenase